MIFRTFDEWKRHYFPEQYQREQAEKEFEKRAREIGYAEAYGEALAKKVIAEVRAEREQGAGGCL